MHCVDLGESFPTSIYLQNLASIQPRTSRLKFADTNRFYIRSGVIRGLGKTSPVTTCQIKRTPAAQLQSSHAEAKPASEPGGGCRQGLNLPMAGSRVLRRPHRVGDPPWCAAAERSSAALSTSSLQDRARSSTEKTTKALWRVQNSQIFFEVLRYAIALNQQTRAAGAA